MNITIFGTDPLTWSTWDKDGVPVFALLGDAHLKPTGIHAAFDARGIGEVGIKQFGRVDQIPRFLQAVERAYSDVGRPEIGTAILKWFAEHGVKYP